MKNFRKVLALILVVATLFSFVAMASAKTADEYKDYEDVKYVEAVDVLTAIGITEGYDGAYHPADPIDRDEVAAMVARLRNGGEIDADLYVGADNVYADVKGQWSEGYVTYCSQLGIINGRNASTFDPDAKVTGTEVLKMLLCVLGYDGAEQGYTGANWQVNVVRDAKKAGLLIDDVDVYAAATRDEVAQYFLNALQSKMVIGYLGEGLIKITNSIWTDFGDFDFDLGEVITPDSANSVGYEVTYCNAVISDDYLWESIEGLEVGTGKDCYERPGTIWTVYNSFGKVVWTGFYVDAPIYSTTAKFELTAIADYINAGYTDIEYFRHGFEVTAEKFAEENGNGTLTEVFVVGDDDLRVCAKSAFVAKVSAINSYSGAVTLVDAAGKTIAVIEDPEVELAVKDIVLFHLCDAEDAEAWTDADAIEITGGAINSWSSGDYFMHDITVLKPETVTVQYGHMYDDINKSNVTAGETYSYNVNYKMLLEGQGFKNGVINFWDVEENAEWDLYFDEYGYIMWAAEHVDTPEYFYAVVEEGSMYKVVNGYEYDEYGDRTEDAVYTATLAKYAGATGSVTPAKETIDAELAHYFRAHAGNSFEHDFVDGSGVPMLIRYEVIDGEFVYNSDDIHEVNEDYGFFAPEGAKLGKESWIIDVDRGIYADGDTVFMIRTTDGLGNYSYKEIVGFENLDRDYIANTVDANDEVAEYTNIQYFTDAKIDGTLDKEFATYVFIDAHYTAAAADHFMIISDIDFDAFDLSVKELYANNYSAYTAYVGGVKSIVLVPVNMELHPGILYTDIVEFIDVAVCGEHKLPLYVSVDDVDPAPGDPILHSYIRIDSKGNKWVLVRNEDAVNSFNGYAMTKCAANFKVFTILVEEVESAIEGSYYDVITVVEETDKILKASDADIEIMNGYVMLNADGEVTAVYRIATNLMDYFD